MYGICFKIGNTEFWKNNLSKLLTTQTRVDRYLSWGIKMKDKIKIAKIKEKSKAKDVAYTIKIIKFKFARYLAWMEEERNGLKN